MPLLMLEAQSPGEIAFSRDAPGHIVALHLQPGQGIIVREHQFLAATGGVQYDYSRIKGFANMLYGGGFWVDQFFAGDHEGVVWIHGYGNVFEKTLEPGETIDIEPGGWVFRDHSVQMAQEVYGFKTGFLGGGAGNLVFNRFTGPGRVGLQSAYFHPPVRGDRRWRRPAAQQGGGGCSAGIIGGLLEQLGEHDRELRDRGISRSIRSRRGSSARSGSAAISCWSTSPASARAGSARTRSCSSRPSPIRRCRTPAPRSPCTSRG